MSAVTAVTFDCWGTLITDSGFSRAMTRRVEAIAEACGIDQTRAADILDRAWREHHNAWLDTKQYGSPGIARFCHAELSIDDENACAALTETIEEAGRLGTQTALEGASDTLSLLRSKGIRTALVCDAGFTPGRLVRGFLDEHGLLEHLEHCTFSNEIGVPKPDPAIFQEALDALGVEASETVHVGDLLRTDIFGARSMGMRSVRITQVNDDVTDALSYGEGGPEPWGEADEIVASHAELPAALRRLGADI